ncbi:MAG: PHP domain-containing protein, partial [Paludibacteraceae bacterium]|nr:PHP domain-containing protein [Paludibacteraceae bacterium]
MKFTHLHVHTHYSVLDGMSKIPDLVSKARKVGMKALAITDHGNMFGVKEFLDCVAKANKGVEPSERFKPIVGVEAYCARRTLFDKDKDIKEINPETGREFIVDRSGWHLILLAKNKQGYKNLCKLVSQSWIDGFYDRARIDKNILEKYHEGLIVCSACLGGEIPQKILAKKISEADESIKWFKKIFGDDFYIEIQRHQTDKPAADTQVFERQQQIIPTLLRLAEENNVKVIATNDVHFVEEEHAEAHDRLICL